MITADIPIKPAAACLEQLRAVSFVRHVSFDPKDNERFDGVLTLRTAQGTFRLVVDFKWSYLDRASVNAISTLGIVSRKAGRTLILFARYIPRPTGERLASAGINFVDLAGNMHLALGKNYTRTILGRAEAQKHHGKRPMTAARLQLLFLLAAEPDALSWPVRQLAEKAGISKSKAAQIRQELTQTKQVSPHPAKDRAWPPRDMEHLLVSGYAEILRPKLLLGRFRSPEAKGEDFIARLPKALAPKGIRFSLTGGPAADLLQHFYRGPETPIFLTEWNSEIQKSLRLLPDREGAIWALRAFGVPVFWRTIGNLTVAHPLLIYAELMNSDDPRAHEAAEELRREFFPS